MNRQSSTKKNFNDNRVRHAAVRVLQSAGVMLDANMIIPKSKGGQVPKFEGLERELQARLRLTYMSVFLQWGNYTPAQAALRAGYPKKDADDPEFVATLVKRALEAGLVAQVDIRPKDLFMTEVYNSWATVIHLRDHSDNHKVRLAAALKLLELAGFKYGEGAWDTKEVTEDEMSHWTKKELIAYFTSGGEQIPERRKTEFGLTEVQGGNDGFEDAQTVDEPRKGKGMLAG